MKERRDEILEAARDLFLAEGLARVTMRRLSERVGVSATALYRHFKDKDELLRGVIAEGHAILARYLFEALASRTPAERLLRTGQRYLDFAFAEPSYYRAIFMTWDHLVPEGAQAPPSVKHGPTFQFLVDRVRECQETGTVTTERSAISLAVQLWALCHGLASLFVAGGGGERFTAPEYQALCQDILRAAMRDLGK